MNQKYLNPEVVNQLNNLYLKAKVIVEGFMAGLHKSPYHGFQLNSQNIVLMKVEMKSKI